MIQVLDKKIKFNVNCHMMIYIQFIIIINYNCSHKIRWVCHIAFAQSAEGHMAFVTSDNMSYHFQLRFLYLGFNLHTLLICCLSTIIWSVV